MVEPFDSHHHVPAAPLPHILDLANIWEIEIFRWVGHEDRTITDLSIKKRITKCKTTWKASTSYSTTRLWPLHFACKRNNAFQARGIFNSSNKDCQLINIKGTLLFFTIAYAKI